MTARATGTVIVTGGTGGLGAAVTRRFLDTGWRTVVPWVDSNNLDRLDAHDRLEPVEADLFDPGSAASVVETAAKDPERPLAAVVNLVGGFSMGPRVHETRVEDFEGLVRLNLRPTFLTSQAALPRLMAAGGGSIVCVASKAAVAPFRGAAGYAVGKAAVLAFVDALAVEYRHDGVRANAVLPSLIDTPDNREAMPDADHSRWVPPEQVAATIAFLAGPESAATSGAHLPVYGRA